MGVLSLAACLPLHSVFFAAPAKASSKSRSIINNRGRGENRKSTPRAGGRGMGGNKLGGGSESLDCLNNQGRVLIIMCPLPTQRSMQGWS